FNSATVRNAQRQQLRPELFSVGNVAISSWRRENSQNRRLVAGPAFIGVHDAFSRCLSGARCCQNYDRPAKAAAGKAGPEDIAFLLSEFNEQINLRNGHIVIIAL